MSIFEAIFIHAFNNLDLHFRPYLAILSYYGQQKNVLSTLSELIKILKDKYVLQIKINR